MFILYQSNDLNVLKHVFLYKFKDNIKFKYIRTTLVIVPDHNLSLFLKMFLAKNLGICANINFCLPAKFIWKIYKKFLFNLPKNYFFKKKNLVFVIMNILPKLINLKDFYILKKYLLHDYNYEKLFSLSCKIADIFDKYLIYRVDWLNKWENFELVDNLKDDIHQLWQSILWRKIIIFYYKKFNCFWNRGNIYYKFLNSLNKKNFYVLKNFVSKLFIFNVSYLPPIYLNTIYLISKYINVHYFILNPSSKYWYDRFFFDKKNINLLKKGVKNSNFNLYEINLLLLNNSKFFSEYLSLFKEFDIIEINCFVKFSKKKLLNKIKNDILSFKNSFILNNFLVEKKNKDDSIIITSSDSYINEVIKLKNFLLNLVKNKKYDVSDILVLVSDLNIYYTYINMIFSDNLCKKYLPFHIMQCNLDYDNKVLKLFLDLLNISNTEFTFSKILYFLKNKIILDKFNISIQEFNVISYFINNDNILTDINNFLFNSNFGEFDYLNLINGIKRILLGYAINDKFCYWNNIISYNTIDNNYFHNLIGKLSDFIFKIYYWKDILNKKYFIYFWIDICKKFLSVFFLKKDIKKNFFLNYKFWFNFSKKYKCFFFKKKIKINLFIKILNFFIFRKKSYQYSISHINFSSFVTLHGISFKVICFLGINDNIYPKNIFFYNFDLIYSNPRLGDNNKVDYDKYIFLKFILSAKEKIYISYLNFSFIKNIKLFPSTLILNLLNYLENFFISYRDDKKNILKYKILGNYLNFKKKNKKNILIRLINKKNIFLNKIHLFLFNPIKYFMKSILKISYLTCNEVNNYNNLFSFNIKRFYFLRLDIINYFLKFNYINDNIMFYLQSLNIIPFGAFGKIVWINEKKKILSFIKNILNLILEIKQYNFFCKVHDFNFYGTIYYINNGGLIKWLPKNLNFIDALVFWVDHLIYCYLGGKNTSSIYGYNGIWTFPYINKNIAEKYLYKYIMYYYYFNEKNIFFLPRSSHFWIFNAYDLKNKSILNIFFLKKVLIKLKNILYGNYFFVGELNDVYINYYLKKIDFKIDINFIILKAEEWLLPMFKYLVLKN